MAVMQADQFICWRAVLHLGAVVEIDHHDLVFPEASGPKPYRAAVELKVWRIESASYEADEILKDVRKLRASAAPEGYVVVISFNPPGLMEKNIPYLIDKLADPASETPTATHRFRTQDPKGTEIEFWLAAWRVNTQPLRVPKIAQPGRNDGPAHRPRAQRAIRRRLEQRRGVRIDLTKPRRSKGLSAPLLGVET